MKTLLIIFISIVPFLMSCQKEPTDAIKPIIQADDSTYIVRYFVNSDSAFIRYGIGNDFEKHYISGHFDTTFYSNGGIDLMLMVTCWQWPMNAGMIVNDSVIDNCFNVHFFESHYYLKP